MRSNLLKKTGSMPHLFNKMTFNEYKGKHKPIEDQNHFLNLCKTPRDIRFKSDTPNNLMGFCNTFYPKKTYRARDRQLAVKEILKERRESHLRIRMITSRRESVRNSQSTNRNISSECEASCNSKTNRILVYKLV